jgi:NAD(P)-dependent dehydrogenase (short-subunit alcohol dehydrogenase family)
MPSTILLTGASSGFGAMTVRALADAGHTVYAGIRDTTGRNAPAVAAAAAYAASRSVDLRTVEMDVSDQASVDAAVTRILDERGRLDVVVHNAGHMVLGPTEAFTPDQLAAVYDTNVLSTQRVNRAALPHLRAQGDGLLIWVGSTSTRGGTPPYLAPYFAAKAAEDSLAVSYAAEVARFGIDTTIIVPGSFTTGTNHFANAGHAADTAVADAYDARYVGLMDQVSTRLAELSPADADPSEVAAAIVRVVATPKGRRPFRVHIDPADDGAEDVNALGDRIRRDFYERIGLADLLSPAGSVHAVEAGNSPAPRAV